MEGEEAVAAGPTAERESLSDTNGDAEESAACSAENKEAAAAASGPSASASAACAAGPLSRSGDAMMQALAPGRPGFVVAQSDDGGGEHPLDVAGA